MSFKKIYTIYDKKLNDKGEKVIIGIAHSAKECSQILDVSERTITTYIQTGRISVSNQDQAKMKNTMEDLEHKVEKLEQLFADQIKKVDDLEHKLKTLTI